MSGKKKHQLVEPPETSDGEIDIEAFHKSLPKEPQWVFYLEGESVQEIVIKANLLVGRVYHDQEGQGGNFISAVRQVHIEKVHEWHMLKGEEQPKAQFVYHAAVTVEYEQYGAVLKDEEPPGGFG